MTKLSRNAETGNFFHEYTHYHPQNINRTLNCKYTFDFKSDLHFDLGDYKYELLYNDDKSECHGNQQKLICEFIIRIYDNISRLHYFYFNVNAIGECSSCDGRTTGSYKIVYSIFLQDLLSFVLVDNKQNNELKYVLLQKEQMQTFPINVVGAALVYGDSLCECLKKVNHELLHTEFFPGKTVKQMVDDDEQEIGLSLFCKESEYYNLIFVGGSNDLGNGFAYESIVDNIIKLLKKVQSLINEKIICFEFSRKQEKNSYYEKRCIENGFVYDDFFVNVCKKEHFQKDGLHLNENGQELFQNHALNYV